MDTESEISSLLHKIKTQIVTNKEFTKGLLNKSYREQIHGYRRISNSNGTHDIDDINVVLTNLQKCEIDCSSLSQLINSGNYAKALKFAKCLDSTTKIAANETNIFSEKSKFESLRILSKDLGSLEKENKFSDVSIKCGKEIFKAHKIILCSRSSVFEVMFQTPMQEHEKDLIIIHDIEPDIFRTFLKYLYTGQVEKLNVPVACSLLYVTEKYHVKVLKDICVSYLISKLSTKNAIEILKFGDLYDDHLKTNAILMIRENFGTLRRSESWKVLRENNSKLALDVYANVCDIFYEA